jgi:hypothetical protein
MDGEIEQAQPQLYGTSYLSVRITLAIVSFHLLLIKLGYTVYIK